MEDVNGSVARVSCRTVSDNVLGTELSAEETVVNKPDTFSPLTGLMTYQKKQALNNHYRTDPFIASRRNSIREKEAQDTVSLGNRGD